MAALAPASVNALVYSSSLVAAFLGGILALFAPCCVVSLLPTFVAVAIERGRRRLPTTALIFSAGVATVLLPIVLGVGALGQLVARYQRVVFLVIGVFLAFLGVSILSGHRWTLPFPSLRLRARGSGPARVYTLGLASGVASSCCAPVVVGVVAMSALAASPLGALGLAMAYVLGMVFPLFLAALFSDRLPQRWARAATSSGGFVFRNRRIAWQDLAAAGMFLAVAAAALALAITGRMSYAPDWLTSWNRWATGLAGDVAVALRGLPILVQGAGIAVLAALVGVPLYRSWPSVRSMRFRLKVMAIAGIALGLVASLFWVVSAGLPPSLKAASIMSEVIPPGSTAAPDFALPDQDGRMISLSAERGQVVAVTFLNLHCADLCPVEAKQLATAQAHLGRATPFVLLVVSVAPDLDTPARVRSFAQRHHWTVGWHWLLGSQTQLAPIWLSYFIDARLSPTAANADNVAHSGALYLIDRSGFERVGFGLNVPPEVIEQDIRALAARGWTWPWNQ